MKDIEKVLRGPVVTLVTPYKENHDVDVDGLKSNVRWIIDEGIKDGSGVLKAAVVGGDFFLLTTDERKAVIKAVVEAADGEAPVYAGNGSTSTKVSVGLARYAEKVGADGLQLEPPFYWDPTDEQIFQHYKAVSESCNLPIIVYNIGDTTHKDIGIDLMYRLLELENVRALKLGNFLGSHYYWFQDMLEEFADKVTVIINSPTRIVYGFMKGAKGWIARYANFWPKQDLRIWRLLEEHRYFEAQKELDRVKDALNEYFKTLPPSLKHGLSRATLEAAGRYSGPPRNDIPATDEVKQKIKEILLENGWPD